MGSGDAIARHAIEALLYRYADHLDRGDLAGVAALFAEARYGGRGRPPRQGAAEVLATLQAMVRIHPDGTPRTLHVTTNVTIAVDAAAGTAVAQSVFTVLQQTALVPLQVIVAGRYSDRFACDDRGWRFTERSIDTDAVGDLRDHLAGPLPAPA